MSLAPSPENVASGSNSRALPMTPSVTAGNANVELGSLARLLRSPSDPAASLGWMVASCSSKRSSTTASSSNSPMLPGGDSAITLSDPDITPSGSGPRPA